jgi:hypothetical protein
MFGFKVDIIKVKGKVVFIDEKCGRGVDKV